MITNITKMMMIVMTTTNTTTMAPATAAESTAIIYNCILLKLALSLAYVQL